jgi:hypothetical protein
LFVRFLFLFLFYRGASLSLDSIFLTNCWFPRKTSKRGIIWGRCIPQNMLKKYMGNLLISWGGEMKKRDFQNEIRKVKIQIPHFAE